MAIKDLRGKRYGLLTCIEPTGQIGKDGTSIWRCRCDCGNETVVWQPNLLSGHTRSCGCRQRQVYKDNLRLVDGTTVTMIEKKRDMLLRSNTSGYNGVYWNQKTGRWRAQITFKGRTYYLGSFENIEDAVRARRRGEEIYDDFLAWYYAQEEKTAVF